MSQPGVTLKPPESPAQPPERAEEPDHPYLVLGRPVEDRSFETGEDRLFGAEEVEGGEDLHSSVLAW